MKKLLFFLFVSVGLNAQFNYQAIVKDSDGNPVTNNQVKFKFSLMYQSSTATPVYAEEHTVTTPPDGVNNLSVGGGTVVNGTFSSIDWSQSVFMKEELDTGSGYQDMGTKQIASVPVAEYAKSSGSSISSLTFVDSSNNLAIGTSVSLDGERNVAIGIGVLSDESSNAKYNVGIGYGALSNITSGTGNIAVGDSSLYTLDNGYNNVAIGDKTLYKNLSNDNIAVGGKAMSNNTSGTANIAVGTISLYNNSDGSNSIAIGHGALYGSIGEYNIAIGNNAMYSSSNTSSNTGVRNLAIGYNALYENSNGSSNVAIGNSSLYNNLTGFSNVAIGNSSLYNNLTGYENTAIGNSLFNNLTGVQNIAIGGALSSNTSGDSNIGIGVGSLSSNVVGSENLAIGNHALHNNIASRNTAIGSESLSQNVSGTVNTSVGYLSLYRNVSGNRNAALGDGALFLNEDGSYNVAIGNLALTNNVSGSSNVSIGDASLYNSISSNNVALGDGAGYGLNTENSNENTFIGYNANTVSGTQINNSTAIGARAVVTTSNTIQLGDDYVELINTSGVINAYDFQINGESKSIAQLVGDLESLQADMDMVLEDIGMTFKYLYQSDEYRQTIWKKLGLEEDPNDPDEYLLLDFDGPSFITNLNGDNSGVYECVEYPSFDSMYGFEVDYIFDGTTSSFTIEEYSLNNITIKISHTDFDDNNDGEGWSKVSISSLNKDLILVEEYYSDGYIHYKDTYKRINDPNDVIFAQYSNICD